MKSVLQNVVQENKTFYGLSFLLTCSTSAYLCRYSPVAQQPFYIKYLNSLSSKMSALSYLPTPPLHRPVSNELSSCKSYNNHKGSGINYKCISKECSVILLQASSSPKHTSQPAPVISFEEKKTLQ